MSLEKRKQLNNKSISEKFAKKNGFNLKETKKEYSKLLYKSGQNGQI
jgi:HJR/Mrr/RecB family endonuclease